MTIANMSLNATTGTESPNMIQNNLRNCPT
ncbi:Uncharacterised protein [Mycobacteroides abscessus subsp. massiliense]|nr:Uncharacterised protein [Mycobacteroides abscessus subsp. massiliense]